ncbi:hypothetical protein BC828DRAFT_374234 [Blastocladiella britannica]|nr:hypothetical protein BC828DRAFT_374234 [Blastocladiella britannica]
MNYRQVSSRWPSTQFPSSALALSYNHSSSVGLHSHLSDRSAVSFTSLSMASAPAQILKSHIAGVISSPAVDRAMVKMNLRERKEYERGRASRIAQCYREKLDDIQRQRSGLPEWCNKHMAPPTPMEVATAVTAIDEERTEVETIVKSKLPPLRTDSHVIAESQDLDSMFLEAAAHLDAPSHAITPLPQATPQATPSVEELPQPPVPLVSHDVMQRLANIFPFHPPESLAEALLVTNASEFDAIHLLLQAGSATPGMATSSHYGAIDLSMINPRTDRARSASHAPGQRKRNLGLGRRIKSSWRSIMHKISGWTARTR